MQGLARKLRNHVGHRIKTLNGIARGPVHRIAHDRALACLGGGADVRVVQELLGHASVSSTQIYTMVTVERLREVYATAHPRARA